MYVHVDILVELTYCFVNSNTCMYFLVGILVNLPFILRIFLCLYDIVVNCMFFLVGILANPPLLKRGTEKKKRAAYPNLRSARGEMTVSSADV